MQTKNHSGKTDVLSPLPEAEAAAVPGQRGMRLMTSKWSRRLGGWLSPCGRGWRGHGAPPTWLNDRTDQRSVMRAPIGQEWQAAHKGEGHPGPRTWESAAPSPNKAANVDGGRVCRLRSGLQCGGKPSSQSWGAWDRLPLPALHTTKVSD